MRKEEYALLALNAVPHLGPASVAALVQGFGGALQVLAQLPAAAARPEGAPLQAWDAARLWQLAASEEARLRQAEAQFSTWAGADYPEYFYRLAAPPPALIYRGDWQLLAAERLRVAVIGARACTPYGRTQAGRFGAGLAAQEAVVVSGAARGIDQAAMEGAWQAEGKVVAVIGSGIDCPYPPESRPLLERIVQRSGLVLTEFPCGMPPHRENFPRRNRLMAAMSDAVVVVQATVKSGSMITVEWALRCSREVMAVPGPVDSVVSHGPHELIRDGAAVVESPEDVLVELRRTVPRAAREAAVDANSPLARVLAGGDRSANELAGELTQPVETVLLELVQLELSGKVVRLAGGVYHLCRPFA